jgi:ribokinase
MYASEPRAPHVVVVGSTNTDLVVAVPHIPAPGETILGGALRTIAGGKGANQAVAAARLGARVTFVARVGDDAFGKNAVEGFRREGIDTTYVGVTPGVASGVALIPVSEETGENAIVVAPGANAYLTEADVDAAAPAFDAAAAVVVSLEVPLEAVTRTVEMGWARRIPVILNPAPARSLPPELLTRITVLTPNETEALQLLATRESLELDILAAHLLDLGVDTAVMTVGPAGAIVATPDGVEMVAGIPVRAVDTVAAGDCFTGALAVEFASGRSLRDAVSFANTAAAVKVTRPGAQPGLPKREEVVAFVAARARGTA